MYPEYQTHAAITVGAWNHVRLVISGRRMNVFINGAAEPTLAVGRLEAAPCRAACSSAARPSSPTSA